MKKRRITGWLMAAMVTVTVASGSVVSTLPAQAAGTNQAAVTGMANPFTEYRSLAEAQKAAGFELKLPLVVPDGYANPVYRAIPGEFLEVVWTNADGDELRYRKCPSAQGDASGDYNDYSFNHTYRVGGMDVRVRGSKAKAGKGKGKSRYPFSRVNVISTASERYSYAMTSTAGLTPDQLLQVRRGFIDQWLPSALAGFSAADTKNFMKSFGKEMYDTGVSLIYSDMLNPDYFFYIPLDENGNTITTSYMRNEVYHLD